VPSYHCTACGAYWLKDSQLVCGTAREVEQRILAWMDEQPQRDADLGSTAHVVVHNVITAGLRARAGDCSSAERTLARESPDGLSSDRLSFLITVNLDQVRGATLTACTVVPSSTHLVHRNSMEHRLF